jgi:hypothetical protein
MAVRRRQGRLDPVGAKRGGREAEKRVLWGHMAAVYAGRAENSAWVAYAVQQILTSQIQLPINTASSLPVIHGAKTNVEGTIGV